MPVGEEAQRLLLILFDAATMRRSNTHRTTRRTRYCCAVLVDTASPALPGTLHRDIINTRTRSVGSRVRGSRVRIPGLTLKGSSALRVWVARRHPVTSWFERGGAVREFCAGHACSPESSGRQWQGEAGIPSRGRYLRRCPRDPWDLFCFHLQTRKNSSFLLGRREGFFVGVDTMRCPCISNA